MNNNENVVPTDGIDMYLFEDWIEVLWFFVLRFLTMLDNEKKVIGISIILQKNLKNDISFSYQDGLCIFICHPWRDKVVLFERLMILIIISPNGLDI